MRLLTDRNVRLLWTAGSIASFGAWLLIVAVPLEVFRRTGSPVATGLALAAEVLPAVLIGPWAGVLVDRWHRKYVLVLAYLVGAAGLTLMLSDRLALIYAGVLVEAFAVVFLAPALRAVGPGLAGSEANLASLNAWTSFTNSVFRMLGPPLGTLLAARGLFSVVVLLDVLGYLTAAVLISRLTLPFSPASGGVPPRIREGVRHILGTPILRGLLATSWLFLAANAAVTALFVPFVADRMDAPPSSVGVLISGLGVGYLIGSALSKVLLDRCPTRAVLVCAYA